MTVIHSSQCGWHCDQYDSECDCGAINPMTAECAKLEVLSAQDRLERAEKSLEIAEKKLKEFGDG